MHTAQTTAQGRIIRFYPLKIWCLCLFLATLGLGTMVGLGRVTTLSCNRITPWAGTCVIESLGLEGDRRQTLALATVHRARLNTTASIVLDTSSGPIPLTAPLGSNPNLSRALVVNQINKLLANPVAIRLTFQDDGRPFAYPFGIIFLLGSGTILVLFGPIVSYEVDRSIALSSRASPSSAPKPNATPSIALITSSWMLLTLPSPTSPVVASTSSSTPANIFTSPPVTSSATPMPLGLSSNSPLSPPRKRLSPSSLNPEISRPMS
ncbi:MAG: hypothetical protein ACO4AI_16085 [Prochlorothrix sp.]